MTATVLKPGENVPDPINPDDYGTWVESQDPLTGEIVKVWKPFEDQPDIPETDYNEFRSSTINCLARGIVDGGIRVAGTTERFGDTYENIDFVKMWVPASRIITKRDRITNIKNPKGQVVWLDEEFDDPNDLTPPKATVFNVNGVTPLFDAFNRHTENFVLLERAEVYA
jgi:hypothetical protein